MRGKEARGIVTDACVPVSRLADIITATAADVREQSIVGPIFGHAGDGNFHCILVCCDDDDDDYKRRVKIVNDNIVKRAIEMGGTCTGEHGIGIGKMRALEEQAGDGAVSLMKVIKRALDPKNIMNPGKIVNI
jgi:D-lactate dehydrogenase (cytochrome)